MIQIKGLTRRFGDFTAVDDLTFDVDRGEAIGLLGPNGAGKTTTMRMMTGVLAPTSGTVTIGGIDLAEKPVEVKKRIGYLPEQPPLYNEMTVSDYLRFAGSLHLVPASALEEQVNEAAARCGLDGSTEKVIGTLSKGMKQRVGIAQALLPDPDLLILDEPTIGLDPGQIREIRSLVKNLAGKRTLFFSTHILAEVPLLCERVIIIDRGRIALDSRLDRLPEGRSLEDVFISLIAAEEGGGDESLR